MQAGRRPLLVGAAQLVQRDPDPAAAPEPLEMLARVARAAAADAGLAERGLAGLDTIALVDVVAWRPRNGPRLLAERLGARPVREWLSCIGGEIPLVLVNRAARLVAAGEAELVLVCGCNSLRTRRAAHRQGVELHWSRGGEGAPELVGENRSGTNEREQTHGLVAPTDVYPILENALRARRGAGLESHRRHIAALLSRLSQLAAGNPYAWFPVARSAEEIAAPTPANRMIGYPYTKYMNAVIETDQAAAVLVASEAAAERLGVPEARRIHWWGGARSEERAWFVSERPELWRSRALGRAARGALDGAGVAIGDVRHLDLYSCFPVAVEMACDALGVPEDDPRGLSVTGGLPYAGGPGNSYTLHSLAAMMERLRGDPGAVGLVTGNGWYVTKHAGLVCASAPREALPANGGDPAADVGDPAGPAPLAVAEAPAGRGTLDAYTVVYGRDGAPAKGIAIGRLADGRRFVANTPEDRSLLEAFAAVENVGRAGSVSHRDGRNLFDPA